MCGMKESGCLAADGPFREAGHGAMKLQLPPLCVLFDGQRDMAFTSTPTAKHTHGKTHTKTRFFLLCCKGVACFGGLFMLFSSEH